MGKAGFTLLNVKSFKSNTVTNSKETLENKCIQFAAGLM